MSRTVKSLSSSLGVVLFLAVEPVTYAAEVVCPPQIEIREKLAADPPNGWSPRTSDVDRYLGGITLFEGDPAHMVSLVPDSDRRTTGKERIATWKFVKGQSPIWISCRYNATGITFSRPLRDDVRWCTLIYASSIVIKKISCQ